MQDRMRGLGCALAGAAMAAALLAQARAASRPQTAASQTLATPAQATQAQASQTEAAAASQAAERARDFVYRLPDDWQVLTPRPPAAAQQENQEHETPTENLRKGIACLEVPLTARHGDPVSAIAIVALPIACYGAQMTADSLPAFRAATEGFKRSFAVTDALTAMYALGKHRMWIERARGIALGEPGPVYTLEIVCTVLKKAAVCWLAQASDEPALRAFESAPVTLEGDAAPALVPKDVFLHAR